MSDYGDDSEYEYFDDFDYLDGYIYVEEAFHVADDLAEHAVASPPPFEDSQDYWDWDRFDYWQDIEDGSLGYFDHVEGQKKMKEQPGLTGHDAQKRSTKQKPTRRRKQSALATNKGPPLSPTPTVSWRSQESRNQVFVPNFKLEEQEPIAILKDWKEQFKNSSLAKRRLDFNNKSSKKTDIPSGAPFSPSPESSNAPMQMDQAIQAILANKLSAGGLPQGFDSNTLLEYAMRMVGGSEDADDIAGELAEEMLDHDEDDPTAATITQFILQQKASLNEAPGGLVSSGGGPSSNSSSSSNQHRSTVESPQMQPPMQLSTSTSRAASPLPPKVTGGSIHSSQRPQQIASKKRKADETDPHTVDTTSPKPKRAHRTFDAPTSSSTARSASKSIPKQTKRGGKK